MGKNLGNVLDEILSRLGVEADGNIAEKKNRLRTYLGLIRRSHSCWLTT